MSGQKFLLFQVIESLRNSILQSKIQSRLDFEIKSIQLVKIRRPQQLRQPVSDCIHSLSLRRKERERPAGRRGKQWAGLFQKRCELAIDDSGLFQQSGIKKHASLQRQSVVS